MSLTIEVEYLLGRSIATDVSDRGRPEWPPHPTRLFSACVAAAMESDHINDGEKALEWLEALPPPEIAADKRPAIRTANESFVPINDEIVAKFAGAKRGKERLDPLSLRGTSARQPRNFPSVTPYPNSVQFIWPNADPEDGIRDTLRQIVREVTYLGHSSSLVRVDIVDESREADFTPTEWGELSLRVSRPGRLARLRETHDARAAGVATDIPLGATQPYAQASAHRYSKFGLAGLLTVAMVDSKGVKLGLEITPVLASRLREAILARLEQDIPESLSGHTDDGDRSRKPHLATVPLGHVWGHHGDGTIKALAVLAPKTIEQAERIRLQHAIAEITELKLGALGVCSVGELNPNGPILRSLRFYDNLARPRRCWATITPMILDKHPRRQLTSESIVRESIERAGYPSPHTIATQRFGFRGSEPDSKRIARTKSSGAPLKQLQGRLACHVYVEFGEPVDGPLILGAGRFLGMGLFGALR